MPSAFQVQDIALRYLYPCSTKFNIGDDAPNTVYIPRIGTEPLVRRSAKMASDVRRLVLEKLAPPPTMRTSCFELSSGEF